MENLFTQNRIQYMMLPVKTLKFSDYNRDVQINRVKKMVKKYNPLMVGVLTVSKRPNGFYVVDGQNRLAMLKTLGIQEVICQISSDLDYEDEARLFVDLGNSTKAISYFDKFRGRLESKEPQAIRIKDITEKAGLRIGKNGGQSNNKIVSLKVLDDMYADIGEEGLFRTLSLIKKTWNGAMKSLEAPILKGVGILVKLNGTEFIDCDFVQKMATVDPVVILREGRAASGLTVKGFTAYAAIIHKYYNAGRSVTRISNKFASIEE